MKKWIVVLLLMLLIGCQSADTFEYESTPGCPYNGAVVEIAYPESIPFDEIADLWRDNGWRLANPDGVHGHTMVGLIEGSFDQSGWTVAQAMTLNRQTTISVWVNQERDERQHKRQLAEAQKLLKKVQQPIEQQYKLTGVRHEKMNLGCEID